MFRLRWLAPCLALFSALLLASVAVTSASGIQSQSCVSEPAGECYVGIATTVGDHVIGNLTDVGYSGVVQFWVADSNGNLLHGWGVVGPTFPFSFVSNQTGTLLLYFANVMDEEATENVTVTYEVVSAGGTATSALQTTSSPTSAPSSSGTTSVITVNTSSSSTAASPGGGWSEFDTFGVSAAVIVVASVVAFAKSRSKQRSPAAV